MLLKSSILWDITPCSSLKINRRFRGACRLPSLVSCLAYTSTLKMEAACASETSAGFQRTTRRNSIEGRTIHNHHYENHKSYIGYYWWSFIICCFPDVCYSNDIVACRPVANQRLCKQRPLLGNSRNIHDGVMQSVSKQRIGKHAYNSGVVGNGVFYSICSKSF
jgi:hypothetical protein